MELNTSQMYSASDVYHFILNQYHDRNAHSSTVTKTEIQQCQEPDSRLEIASLGSRRQIQLHASN